ncbi:ferric enterobactin transport protein FepE [Citrobacter koseri]|uniref:Ferric enterobactin transport protein FepE n=1 Tax=Citrobacter koseri TaxID=545 RepID=A0A2X2X5V6_CITKO|nr:ferric enterobactin transport protein FepE [Citrobacter koseri]
MQIEKSVTDVAEINAEIRNRQYYVEQLTAMNINDVKFMPFKYQLSPSLPVKKDGPGKALDRDSGCVAGWYDRGAAVFCCVMPCCPVNWDDAIQLEERLV